MPNYNLLKKAQSTDSHSANQYENSLGDRFVKQFKRATEYIQDSKFGRAAEKVGRTVANEVKFLTYDGPVELVRENVGIPEGVSTKDGIKHAVKNYFMPEINDKWDYLKLGCRYAGIATLIAMPVLTVMENQVSQSVKFNQGIEKNVYPGEGWNIFPIPVQGKITPPNDGGGIPGELPNPPPTFPLSDTDNFYYVNSPWARIGTHLGVYGLFETIGNLVPFAGRSIQAHRKSKKQD